MQVETFNNPGCNPNSDHRRTGGSVNDPHGGHEHITERRGPDPDPINELVPAGDGGLPATKLSVSERETLAFTESQNVGHPETTEGSGKFQQPVLRGDNELHIDPGTTLPTVKTVQSLNGGSTAAAQTPGLTENNDRLA
jgi:hypothetical protein